MIRAVLFDLDGTLVDSRLDFDAMRRDLGFPPRTPILEGIAALPAAERPGAERIVLDHELAGAHRATPMPGAAALLAELARRDIRTGIFTRNARSVTALTLERTGLAVDLVVAREDAAPKPAPDGLLQMLATWGIPTPAALYVGDYLYDLQAGANAAIRTILYAPEPPGFPHAAPDVITALSQVVDFL